MRELTKQEERALETARDNHNLWIDSAACSAAFNAAFIAGLECHEAQTADLPAALQGLVTEIERRYAWNGSAIEEKLQVARAALASVDPSPLFSIWQRFRRNKPHGTGEWGLWDCTLYVDMPEADARAILAEVEADELERRGRYPESEAIYEIRLSTRAANVEAGEAGK